MTTKVLSKGPHTRSKNSQYFEAKNGRPIFDKIFDAILPTHVPSKFIALKMFDPDAAVAVALVLAKCSPEDWIFNQNFDRSPHASKYWTSCQNIDDWSKYKQIWSVNILCQCIFWQRKISHTRSKIQSKFWCQYFASIYWRIFWSCMAPLRHQKNICKNC